MSFDIDIVQPACDHCGNTPQQWEWCGLTYNLAPMMREGGLDLRTLDGMATTDALPIVEELQRQMMGDEARFVKQTPENGWGDFDGLIGFVDVFVAELRNRPDGTVYVT